MEQLTCNRCHYVWSPATLKTPKSCPGCKSPLWNKERVRRVAKGEKRIERCSKCVRLGLHPRCPVCVRLACGNAS